MALAAYQRLTNGEPFLGPVRVTNLRRDGRVIHIDLIDRRVDWDGRPAVQSTILDVTAQVEAHRTERLLREALDGIPDGFVLYDSDDRMVFFNERFRRTDPQMPDLSEVIGKRFDDVLRILMARGIQLDFRLAEDPEGWAAARIERHRNPTGDPVEQRLPDGRWLLVREWRTDEGCTVGIHTDITDIKQREGELRTARDRLEAQAGELATLADKLERARAEAERGRQAAVEANDAKSLFLANMSHELRTPLNAIIGFSELIKGEVYGEIPVRRYVEYAADIHRAGAHLLSLINDVLDMSKVEAGKMEIQPVRLDIRALVDPCLSLVGAMAAGRGVDLRARTGMPAPSPFADIRASRQILVNLLSNAIKFTPPGGCVILDAAAGPDGGTIVTVSDTGIGMTAEEIEKAVEPFGQVNSPMTRHEQGTGIGLPLAKALTELHGGSLTIASTPGQGTVVTVRLPPG